jgi:hypothetical protein
MNYITPPEYKLLRQIAAYPHYDILRKVNNLPSNLQEDKLYEIACKIDKYFELTQNNMNINYDKLIEIKIK